MSKKKQDNTVPEGFTVVDENLEENLKAKQAEAEVQEEVQEEPVSNEEVEAVKGQLAQQEDKYLRLAAEYDNYRKRTAKEKDTI